MSRGDVLAILLAHNEADCVATTVHELRERARELDFVVVDDGSHDDTAAEAERAGATVLRHATRRGVAQAEVTGLEYARAHGYLKAVRLDADGQHDPASAAAMIEALNRADLIIGSRFLGDDAWEGSLPRRLGGRALTAMISLATGQRITDPTSGFRAFGPPAMAMLCGAQLHGYPEPESILLALRSGLRVAEVPVTMRPRRSGSSSLTAVASTLFMARATLAVARELLRRR